MFMYGIEPIFWAKLILLLAIVLILSATFNAIMRKQLKVEKKKLFSYNHVNEKHKKIDLTIRIVTIVLLLLGFAIMRGSMDKIWFLQPWFILIISIGISEMVRAVMEQKYAENANDYKLTFSQLIFTLIIFLILFMTKFFGLF